MKNPIRRLFLSRLHRTLERNCTYYIAKVHRKEPSTRWQKIKFRIWSNVEFKLRNFIYPAMKPVLLMKIKTPYSQKDLTTVVELIRELNNRFPGSIIKLTNGPLFED